jgi:hypothetical protein
MLRIACCAALMAALTACGAMAADEAQKDQAAAKGVALFNGKNLEGWTHHLVDADVKMEDVWRVEDGVLICKGAPLGYLETKDSFQDFRLVVEWRWPADKEPGNSGVLLRIGGKPIGFMPKCVEAQLKHGSAGDIWGFRGFRLTGAEDRLRKVDAHKELGDFVGVGKIKDAEKKPGEWNKYVITLVGDTMTVSVNGEKVNEAAGLDVDGGPIGLQSEGGEIHFRTVRLRPMEEK